MVVVVVVVVVVVFLRQGGASVTGLRTVSSSPKRAAEHVAVEEISSVLSKMGFYEDAGSLSVRVSLSWPLYAHVHAHMFNTYIYTHTHTHTHTHTYTHTCRVVVSLLFSPSRC